MSLPSPSRYSREDRNEVGGKNGTRLVFGETGTRLVFESAKRRHASSESLVRRVRVTSGGWPPSSGSRTSPDTRRSDVSDPISLMIRLTLATAPAVVRDTGLRPGKLGLDCSKAGHTVTIDVDLR